MNSQWSSGQLWPHVAGWCVWGASNVGIFCAFSHEVYLKFCSWGRAQPLCTHALELPENWGPAVLVSLWCPWKPLGWLSFRKKLLICWCTLELIPAITWLWSVGWVGRNWDPIASNGLWQLTHISAFLLHFPRDLELNTSQTFEISDINWGVSSGTLVVKPTC